MEVSNARTYCSSVPFVEVSNARTYCSSVPFVEVSNARTYCCGVQTGLVVAVYPSWRSQTGLVVVVAVYPSWGHHTPGHFAVVHPS